jgi:hypothetical protein
MVTAPLFTANAIAGSYEVKAYTGGKQIASFPLVNLSLDVQRVSYRGGFKPPQIATLELAYSYTEGDGGYTTPPQLVMSCNDHAFVRHPELEHNQSGAAIAPFTRTSETRPALYLGFDAPFSNRPMQLFASFEPPLYEAPKTAGEAAPAVALAPPRLVYEYSGAAPSGAKLLWRHLEVQDETNAMSERGLLAFIGPPDMAPGRMFGRTLYWLRVRWESGSFRAQPRIRHLLTNTTWGVQALSVRAETLGSSDGSANQAVQTTYRPVLPGQQIEVREPELPPALEQAVIRALEGADAIAEIRGAAGQVSGAWVRWHAVDDFYTSGPRDRHYTLDAMSGTLRFGDGRRGMIAPLGRNVIRAAYYRTGGGARGNVPSGSLTQLTTALPSIDSVTNVEPAGGGADEQPLEAVRRQGPLALRHRNRAVTQQDYVDLAHAASPDVGRALAIGPLFSTDLTWLERDTQPPEADASPSTPAPHDQLPSLHRAVETDHVTLIIVAQGGGRLEPSLDLISRVQSFVQARGPATVDVSVIGPQLVEVTVQARVAPRSPIGADALRQALVRAVETFLHPLAGGDGSGWAFGRFPHESDVYAVLERFPGVDYIQSLRIEPRDAPDAGAHFLVSSGNHDIQLILPGEGA